MECDVSFGSTSVSVDQAAGGLLRRDICSMLNSVLAGMFGNLSEGGY